MVAAGTDGSCPYAACGSMCSLSRSLAFPHGGVVGFLVVTIDCELVPMSALRQQPVSFAINEDQSSFPLCCCTLGFPHGSVVGFQDETTDCEQVLMSAMRQQPVSFAVNADQSSFPLRKTGSSPSCTVSLSGGVVQGGDHGPACESAVRARCFQSSFHLFKTGLTATCVSKLEHGFWCSFGACTQVHDRVPPVIRARSGAADAKDLP